MYSRLQAEFGYTWKGTLDSNLGTETPKSLATVWWSKEKELGIHDPCLDSRKNYGHSLKPLY